MHVLPQGRQGQPLSGNTVHAFDSADALGELDAVGVAELIKSGDVSTRDVTEAAIARAEKVNPQLNGIQIATFEQALRDADRPRDNGVFFGVPTFIKDNTDLAGHPTNQGSRAVNARPAREHADFTRQLPAQSFTVLGKSTMPEFGFNATTEYQDLPPTRNPWNTDYSSGASSGGSAALVAAGVVPVAHANDGGGSIRIPAAACGLVGLKVTRGRVVDAAEARTMPVNEKFIDDFTHYWGMLAFATRNFGKKVMGPDFDKSKTDDFTNGLAKRFVRQMHRTPFAIRNLKRSEQVYREAFKDYDLVLSPTLGYTTPKLGYLSPDVPFDVVFERLVNYVAFTPLNNAAGGPAISLPLGTSSEGMPVGVHFSADHGSERALLELAFELEAAKPFARIQD